MKYIQRNKSIITGKKNLEHLYEIKNFPAFISYVENNNESEDLRANMQFGICPDSGIIQLEKVLPLDIVYQAEHSVGIGKVWREMYADFASFINKYAFEHVLEIGGGNGTLAKLYTKKRNNITWTIIEPLPLLQETNKIKIIKGWFNEDFKYSGPVDAIVHSHTFEHIYDPNDFLRQIHAFLNNGAFHFFSVPNLYKWLSSNYTNTINFEHTIFLTEYFIDYLIQSSGFKIVEKKYHHNHSIFYATQKTTSIPKIDFESKYYEYKMMFNKFIEYHNDLITNLNKKMEKLDCEVYVFGAHIFSQFLLEFGLNKTKIKGIVDNATVKHNKRLYGTPFTIYPLEEVVSQKKVAIVLKAAEYQEEIRKQILSINKEVIILE